MTREALIQKAITALRALPPKKAEEAADFIHFLLQQHEEALLQTGIQSLQAESGSFDFLDDEEDLYKSSDIKEKF